MQQTLAHPPVWICATRPRAAATCPARATMISPSGDHSADGADLDERLRLAVVKVFANFAEDLSGIGPAARSTINKR